MGNASQGAEVRRWQWPLGPPFPRAAASLRLRFDEPLESRYQDFQRSSRLVFLRVGLLLSLALMGGFLLVDGLWLHHYPQRVFVTAVAVIVPSFILAFMATVNRRLEPQAMAAACVALVTSGLVLPWAGIQVDGPLDQPPYMFGSCIVYLPFVYFFSAASFRVNTAIACAFSLLCVILQAHSGRTAEVQFTSGYLLLAINGVGAVGRYIIDRAHRHDFLAQQQVRELAERDALTGLYNRRAFRDRFQQRLDQARRGGLPLSVLLLDIDHFKSVNDLGGHAFGDAILHETALGLGSTPHADDCIARLGGDEFGLVWQHLDGHAAAAAAEALRLDVAARHRVCVERHCGPAALGIGTSIGVTTIERLTADDTVDTLLRRADEALYAAKRGGRGRVVAA